MADEPAAPSPAKGAKKKRVSRSRKGGPTLPKQILDVVAESKSRKGMSIIAIKKALKGKGVDVKKNNRRINLMVVRLVVKMSLKRVSGVGANGSFKVEEKKKKVKTPGKKKPTSTKVKKRSTAKKTPTPKKSKAKSEKKSPKKKTTKKTATKKATPKKTPAKKITKRSSVKKTTPKKSRSPKKTTGRNMRAAKKPAAKKPKK